ncbi:MAG: hypothetical protein DMG21_12785 [Acidobacteria bacterium]|nr:MAG: hypothetical protein DMG21_12785 [Acidobacteriota bacterium]
MKLPVSPQSVLALVILIGGGTLVGGEYLFVRWYPAHKQRMADQALTPVPYRNTGLGISLDVAKGICEKTGILPGEVRLSRPGLSGGGPSLTIKSGPNPDGASEFSPQAKAIWQSDGSTYKIPHYQYESTQVMGRDAVIIRRPRGGTMVEALHVISPTRIIEAECTPGNADAALHMQACDESWRTLKVEGPPSAPAAATEAVKKQKPKEHVFKLR